MYPENPASSVSDSSSTTSIVSSFQVFSMNSFAPQKWEDLTEHSTPRRTLNTVKSFEISVPDMKPQPDFMAYMSKIRSAPASLSFSKFRSRVKGSRDRPSSEFQAFIPVLGTHPDTNICDTPSQYSQMPTSHTRRSSVSSSNNSTYSRDLDSSSSTSDTSSLIPPHSASIIEEVGEEDDDEIGFSIIKLQLSAQRIGRQRRKGTVPPPLTANPKPRQKREPLSPLEAELSIAFDSPFSKTSSTTSTEADEIIETSSIDMTEETRIQAISLQALSDFASIEEQCDFEYDDDDDDHSSFCTLSADNSDDEDEEFYAPQWPN